MAKILIIGCGDLGTAVALQLHQSQHTVIGLRISQQTLPNGMQTIQADVTKPNTLIQLAHLNPEIIIYCVAASAQTDENYHAHYVQGLKNVLATQIKNIHLQHVFFVSSTRVYGQTHTQNILDENVVAIAADFGGERLLEAENVLSNFPCQSTSLRLSGIYGKGRLYLVNTAKDLSRWPESNSWSNRIHRDDAAGFIAFLVQKVLTQQSVESCYIVTDDMPTLQYDVLTWLANKQFVDTSHIQTPATQGGKRLSNQRLRETGFQLQYPNYQIGYSKVLETL
ncbi:MULTISPECIES: NAD-dependent epimerase/dehydratase family protein [Methylotenera]|uniref:NAD-dependent epimerase/dehydratase family protein n=1 Tax=Methylotenera TaxID=359407 RepID=UPI0003661BF7|nr:MULTISPECIES: NAD-dependent epimerase/dehydratase family protein [Methylotenera]